MNPCLLALWCAIITMWATSRSSSYAGPHNVTKIGFTSIAPHTLRVGRLYRYQTAPVNCINHLLPPTSAFSLLTEEMCTMQQWRRSLGKEGTDLRVLTAAFTCTHMHTHTVFEMEKLKWTYEPISYKLLSQNLALLIQGTGGG